MGSPHPAAYAGPVAVGPENHPLHPAHGIDVHCEMPAFATTPAAGA